MISDDLQHARAEAIERLGALVFCADLCKIEGVAHFVLNVLRAGAKRPRVSPSQITGFGDGCLTSGMIG